MEKAGESGQSNDFDQVLFNKKLIFFRASSQEADIELLTVSINRHFFLHERRLR